MLAEQTEPIDQTNQINSTKSIHMNFLNNKVRQINLDIEPSQRWLPLLKEYKEKLNLAKPVLIKLIEDMFGLYIYPITVTIKILLASGKIYYAEEIQSIADFLGMKFEYILLLQLCLEANSCCTSIVTKVNNEYVFYRTMDWPIEILNTLTVDLEFTKSNKVLFKSTSWVGYVGLATVTIPKKYSIAMNFRITQEPTILAIFQNAKNLVGMNWPIGYLIRDICESADDYDTMMVRLCTSDLVTPCYLTICGADNSDKPKIITRDVNDYEIMRSDYAVQTNCDQNKTTPNILFSVERRGLAIKRILENDNNFASVEELVNKMTTYPIINNETIYYAIMSPKSFTHYSYTYYPNLTNNKNKSKMIRT